FPLEKEYAAASVKQPPLLPGVDVSTLESVKASETFFQEKERDLRGLQEKYSPFYKKLILLPRLMPAGVWLNVFSYASMPMALDMGCSSYAPEEKERSENINKFITNLRQNAEFSRDLTFIDLKSYREAVVQGDIFYLQFDVHCEKRG
ncbi:MAG: hypothetical protein V2A78_06105, partial [bacterium]